MPLSYYITQARVPARAHCETPFTPSPHPSTPLVEILQRWTVCLLFVPVVVPPGVSLRAPN